MTRLAEIFLVFLRLGLTSFGGPVAHLAYFRREFVERRRWLDAEAYAALVALGQFLPGPASSQVGMMLGLMRGGVAGAFAAFVAFTAPSAILMTAFALLLPRIGGVAGAPWVHGLKLAAVAVVAQAVWGMAHGLLKDVPRAILAALAAVAAIALPFAFTQLAVIAAAGLIGFVVVRPPAQAPALPPLPVRGTVSAGALILFVALLGGALIFPSFAAAFYRSGALVFGGGHVVLPLLQKAVVDTGWVDRATFLAGYGAAQAMPGPLFSFAAFLGAATHGIGGAALALGAIYLPSFLLVLGAAPLWHEAHRHPALRAGIAAINAAVVGLLAAALYTPVWTGAVTSPEDGLIAVLLTLLLIGRNVPPWVIVILGIVLALVVPR
ncbi:MAG TPA: chromate efflux transporter [Rhizomicrobium sp.]|jgi:chromate transporter|nr:chromate efflux transporter [Rhizomicrobium sp.]